MGTSKKHQNKTKSKDPRTPALQVNFFQESEKVVDAARREKKEKGDGGGSIILKVVCGELGVKDCVWKKT